MAHGFEKWIIAAWATWRVTSAQQPFDLILDVDGCDTVRQTPLLFIGNNAHRMEGFDAASRESLNNGQLAIYVVKASGLWRLIRLVWRILTGTARKSGELAVSRALSATVSLPASERITHVRVAIDGEVEKFKLPLHYRIRPGALRVIVPGCVSQIRRLPNGGMERPRAPRATATARLVASIVTGAPSALMASQVGYEMGIGMATTYPAARKPHRGHRRGAYASTIHQTELVMRAPRSHVGDSLAPADTQ